MDVSPIACVQAAASELQARKDVEAANLRMKLEMAEDYVDKLRGSLRETEDKLQEARKTYFTVVIGKSFSLNFTCFPSLITMSLYGTFFGEH